MAYLKDSKYAKARRTHYHPVIAGDGHWLEPMPIFLDYLKQVGGPSLVAHFTSKDIERGWYGMTREERLDKRPFRPTWWGEPANTLDRATAMVPKLYYERRDGFIVDVCLREPARLRSLLARVRRPQGGRHRALGQHGLARTRVHRQLQLQPHRPLCGGQPRVRARAHLRRRGQALPDAALRHARGRCGLGLQPRHRSHRALGKAQHRSDGAPSATHQSRSQPPEGSVHALRRASL